MEYRIIRHHRRKRLLVTVTVTGEVIVKSGPFTSEKYIDEFVKSKEDWINSRQQYYAQKFHHRILVTEEERDTLKKQLLPEMKEIVSRYAEMMQVSPKSVKITVAEKRWGSCSGKKTVCFSYRLALVSQRCREYLAVHELSHLKHMDHSKKFYECVEKYMPDYREAEKELDGYYIHLR
ncbi:MAG: M48 family metallopeptidase [Oscillospiraceae bacterium]|nr:M48 family metallopeptidase [Oscillospiraceae bacterium]